MNDFISELKSRGLIAQMTEEVKLSNLLESGTTLYCGFDPTADSLHVGSLLPLITMLRFHQRGHKVLALLGGATGMIGDPSFKAQERSLNSRETVNLFKNNISMQISSIIQGIEIVDNHNWTVNLSVIDFLRDIGKHFSVNNMLSKDSVKNRIERDEQGISFTEFSYQLLQSMDFHHLFKTRDCAIQLGGSDQWGNITSGIDLIHKKEGNHVNVGAITMPLLTKSDGSKFGKSESGTVWLSANKTTPFDFFQFWLKVTDSDIERLFKMLSFKSLEEIERILREDKHRVKPLAQQILAEELTQLVHGPEALQSVLRNNKALFDSNFDNLLEVDFVNLEKNGMKSFFIEEWSLVQLLVQTQLAKSKKEARDFISCGAVFINGKKVVLQHNDFNCLCLTEKDFKFNRFVVLQRGKREFRLLKK